MTPNIAMASGPFSPKYTRSHPLIVTRPPDYTNFLPRIYEELSQGYNLSRDNSIRNPIIKSLDTILTPTQIQHCLTASQQYENIKEYETITGILITKLIQNSHDDGNTTFQLDVRGLKPIHRLGANLMKTKHTLTISCLGTVGYDSANESNDVTFYFQKAGSRCGAYCSSTVYVENPENNCGLNSNGRFYIRQGKSIGHIGKHGAKFWIQTMGTKSATYSTNNTYTFHAADLHRFGEMSLELNARTHDPTLVQQLEIMDIKTEKLYLSQWYQRWDRAERIFEQLNEEASR